MGIICDKLGHKWQLGICKRCGEKMDVEKEVKFIAVCGHVMKPNDIARIKAALLEYHDQEKLAWVISQELAKCDIGMYGGLGNGKAVLQEIGRSVLAQQRR
jgi:hypothetical protein